MGDEGWSADQRAADLRDRGKRSAGAWAAGAEGERRVAAALSTLPSDWLVLHDRLLMPGLAESNIDHLLVGPAGVVLVDAKNWAGHLSEHESTVFQHSATLEGSRRHRPLDREFAVVHSMAAEVSRRTGAGVTAVIALAGRRAADFGEPRMVHDVWVVPVDRLAPWLVTRTRVDLPERQQLEVRARTEFPSTTTDPALLVAMGRALDSHHGVQPRRTAKASRPPARRSHATRPNPSPARSRGRRGSSPTRPGERVRALIGLSVCAGIVWASMTGLLTSVVGAATAAALGDSPPWVAPKPTPIVDHITCSDVDLTTQKATRKLKLTPHEGSMHCEWMMRAKNARMVAAIQVSEIDGVSDRLNPMLKRARAAGRAESYDGYGLDGRTFTLWAPAGTRLSSAKTSPVATRSMSVRVSYEAMEITPKGAAALARSIVVHVSAKHDPIAST